MPKPLLYKNFFFVRLYNNGKANHIWIEANSEK